MRVFFVCEVKNDDKKLLPYGQGVRSFSKKSAAIFVILSFCALMGVDVRVVYLNGDPWFCCTMIFVEALEISKLTRCSKELWLWMRRIRRFKLRYSRKSKSYASFLNLVFTSCLPSKKKSQKRSRKEKKKKTKDNKLRQSCTPGTFAHRFSTWVFRNVIPGRYQKNGAYGLSRGVHYRNFSRRKEHIK